MSFVRYGLTWDEGTSAASVELACYRLTLSNLVKTELPPWEHLYRAACQLFPPKLYARHYWVKERMKCWCTMSFQTWLGPASVAKSTDAGLIVLLHWLSAPDRTTVVVCSTTKPMLEKRIFGELVKYYSHIPGAPGRYVPSESSIVLGDENSKNGIFGVAVLRGSTKDALGNIVGLHNTYNVLIVDEMQSTRPAAVEAFTNLSASGKESLFLGMGNPESRLDPLGIHSEPLEGWASLDPHDPNCRKIWPTRFGHCVWWDGLLSPNIVEPDGEKKYPFLLGRRAIEATAKSYGEDSPQFWSQRRGFFPPEGLDRAMFSESFLLTCGATKGLSFPATPTQEPHVSGPAPSASLAPAPENDRWAAPPIAVAGTDPAFSALGDRCILYVGDVGATLSGRFLLVLRAPILIPLVAGGEVPLTIKLAEALMDYCRRFGVEPRLLGLDCTGAQGAVADILEDRGFRGVLRIQFGGKPSELPVSSEDDTPPQKLYANRVTELWHRVYQFARHGHLRGMATSTVIELCKRRMTDRVMPMEVESKRVMKSRVGASPDEADALAVLAAVVRERLGVVPGSRPDLNDPRQRLGLLTSAAGPAPPDYQDDDSALQASYTHNSEYR